MVALCSTTKILLSNIIIYPRKLCTSTPSSSVWPARKESLAKIKNVPRACIHLRINNLHILLLSWSTMICMSKSLGRWLTRWIWNNTKEHGQTSYWKKHRTIHFHKDYTGSVAQVLTKSLITDTNKVLLVDGTAPENVPGLPNRESHQKSSNPSIVPKHVKNHENPIQHNKEKKKMYKSILSANVIKQEDQNLWRQLVLVWKNSYQVEYHWLVTGNVQQRKKKMYESILSANVIKQEDQNLSRQFG